VRFILLQHFCVIAHEVTPYTVTVSSANMLLTFTNYDVMYDVKQNAAVKSDSDFNCNADECSKNATSDGSHCD